jgi:hypothetical protein
MNRRGAAPRPSHVREPANILLSKRGGTTTQTVGEKCEYNSINRHDGINTEFL